MQRAQQIEPTTLSMNANVGLMLYFNRAYVESKARIDSVLALDSRYDYAHSLLGRTLAALGETDAACAALARALPDHSQLVGFISIDPAMDKLRRAPCVQEAQRRLAGS